MSEFLRAGDKVVARPEGMDYTLENGRVYNLKWNGWDDKAYLEMDGTLKLPEKTYETEDDALFIDRVLNYFNTTDKNTVGVLCSGLKGSGKTMSCKMIAQKSNLPIIVVDTGFMASHLNDFFTKFKQEVCVIFDEIEKNERTWNTDKLLGFLDGVQTTCKKLVLMTCNNDESMSEFVKDRCSRIRYYRKFSAMSDGMVYAVVNDKIKDTNLAEEVAKYAIDNFVTLSYDNLISFIEELFIMGDKYKSLDDVSKDLNIMLKNNGEDSKND